MTFVNTLTTKRILTRRNIVGSKWFNIFRGFDGINYEIEITGREYGKIPTIPWGSFWKGAYSRRKFDTTDGELGEKDYAIDGKQILIKVSGIYMTLPVQMISNNKLLDSGINEILDRLKIHNLHNQLLL